MGAPKGKAKLKSVPKAKDRPRRDIKQDLNERFMRAKQMARTKPLRHPA